MAKRTAVIDIGSNSIKLAIFEKSSAYAFHLIKEIKSRIRIAQGAYENGNVLQEKTMNNAYNALEDFSVIIKNLKCRKVFCVATSALRDASNGHYFIKRIKKELNLHIRVISGEKEARLGALCALNLLQPIQNATTIDIGGGSTELACIEDGEIIDAISINLGTVRLKELFYDEKNNFNDAIEFINESLKKIPERFKGKKVIGIGGTLRAFSNIIIDSLDYPIKMLHGFEYNLDEYKYLLNQISTSKIEELSDLGVSKDKHDTMREGCAIFNAIATKLEAKSVVTNGAGLREGVYLSDLLRSSNQRFPKNFKISERSLSDRFISNTKENLYISKIALKLFDTLKEVHQIDSVYKNELKIASKLCNIGRSLDFDQENLHSFYLVSNGLKYNFSHSEKALIAILIKYNSKKLPSNEDVKTYKKLLPKRKTLDWLSFIISFAKCLNTNFANEKLEFFCQDNTLTIKGKDKLFLAKECIKKLVKPAPLIIVIESK